LRALPQIFKDMEREARSVLLAEGFAQKKQRHERSLAMRYRGQSFELEVKETSGDIVMAFHAVHRERYGYAQEENQVEIVSARLRSFGLVEQLEEKRSGLRRQAAKPSAQVMAYFSGKRAQVGVYRRDQLSAGMKLRTPCIVTEYSATTLVPGDAEASLDPFGNLIIRL
ncbi:MAG TPA: hypothetical protein VKB46_26075, partial [Pyrinomonadaceae bacterium]|nr:hypothetical protein [Pyrinomonadaceae bacterium]